LKSASQESPDDLLARDPGLRDAFAADEQVQRVRMGKVGALLIAVLMPAGVSLDFLVYGSDGKVGEFLILRLISSALALGLWAVLRVPRGERYARIIGPTLALIPSAFIAVMIAKTDGWDSPYYAGLNLVLLAVNVVVHWNLVESLVVSGLIVAFYVIACVVHGGAFRAGDGFNNLYFLTLTGIIVVTGNVFFNRLRRREFIAREELKLSEQRLAETNRSLQSSQHKLESSNLELKLREQDLEQTNNRLRELDESKGRFFANISHELRTPLTLLIAPLETFRGSHASLAEPAVREHLDTMHSNGMRLLKLINDLLELVRLDSGTLKLQPAPVPAADFLRGLLRALRGVADEKGLRLQCQVADDVAHLLGDADKLEKVFLNLLFNAVKFTPAGGEVAIHAHREGALAVIAVRDTGMGINPQQLPFIFDRFWQADSSTQRKFQGAGIGLSLVKELVEAHGGSVGAESTLGRGTTMIVRLPLATSADVAAVADAKAVAATDDDATSQPAEPKDAWLEGLYRRAEMFSGIAPLKDSLRPWTPAAGNRRRPKLLLADDEPDMLRFLKSQLAEDYEVIEAVDGNQALSLATQMLPEIMVCDMMMPGRDGLSVCRELRKQAATRSQPFLMLTARADEETKLQALAAGASDFLPKPFSSQELRLRLKNLVDSHQLQKELSWQNRRLETALEQLKETETQLVQTEKLASLGRLCAGIIHEINNPLNYALGAMVLIRRAAPQLPADEQADFKESVADAEDGLKRVSNIVADLRSFTHSHGGPVEAISARETLNRLPRLFAAELNEQVKLSLDVPDGLSVRANANQLLQVLINLIQNSLDALKARPADAPPGEVRVRAGLAGAVPFISVRDNGPGIPADLLSRIFDPFFTTKAVGSGMGLGLSICYRIMEESGGRIRVNSRPGEFCEFVLEFAADSQV